MSEEETPEAKIERLETEVELLRNLRRDTSESDSRYKAIIKAMCEAENVSVGMVEVTFTPAGAMNFIITSPTMDDEALATKVCEVMARPAPFDDGYNTLALSWAVRLGADHVTAARILAMFRDFMRERPEEEVEDAETFEDLLEVASKEVAARPEIQAKIQHMKDAGLTKHTLELGSNGFIYHRVDDDCMVVANDGGAMLVVNGIDPVVMPTLREQVKATISVLINRLASLRKLSDSL